MKKYKKKSNLGFVFVMLGVGLILALAVPEKYLVVILAVALTISGIALCKS
ncbi:MAG: hypothetical protein IJL63_00640 [Clostridia bacterium]|nr:hypothetical protein [Clostridia bacterium]